MKSGRGSEGVIEERDLEIKKNHDLTEEKLQR